MKQTSVTAADYSSTSGKTRRSYVGRSWQSWCVGSEDHYEPLIVATDYEWTHIDARYGGVIWC